MKTGLRFESASSCVDPVFWAEMGRKKASEWKLSEEPVVVCGHFGGGSGKKVAIPPRVHLDSSAFQSPDTVSCPRFSVLCSGSLVNVNTKDGLKKIDKMALLRNSGLSLVSAMGASADSGTEPSSDPLLSRPSLVLNHFDLISFADMKRHVYYYWFCFPTVVPRFAQFRTVECQPFEDCFGEDVLRSLQSAVTRWFQEADCQFQCLWFARIEADDVEFFRLTHWSALKKHFAAESDAWHLCAVDSGSLPRNPSSMLRNSLAWFYRATGMKPTTVSLLCLRDFAHGCRASLRLKLAVDCTHSPEWAASAVQFGGWEKDCGKNRPKKVDLKSSLDSKQLMRESTQLNLRLMKWRMAPELSLRRVADCSCLLLGAGTLGCAVARQLLAYGVQRITLVDNGTVSYSNPVRQSLYTLEDCLESRPKAHAAAAALRKINPNVKATGIPLTIAMPGHSEGIDQIQQLLDLIREHSVVFLLTDSRESRWLPTVLCRALDRLCINVALGFDTYVVMRHGTSEDGLGCYFCQDIVAPSDSLSERTLDQQCTVTRPGVSPMAAALAVELMVCCSQRPTVAGTRTDAFFGCAPHQIRGTLSVFDTKQLSVECFHQCVGCSKPIVGGFKADGLPFVTALLKDPKGIEEVCGLTQMKREMETKTAAADTWLMDDFFVDSD